MLNQPASSTAPPATVSLTVQREVPGIDYLWIPVIAGLATAFLFIVLAGVIGLPYREKLNQPASTAHFFDKQFWTTPVYASAAWSFNDSWATNITAFGAAIASLLTAAGAFSSIFPGVELGRFALLNVACGGLVVIAPLLFGVLNVMCSRRRAVFSPDAEIKFDKRRAATIMTPAGANIIVAGGARFGAAHIKPGGAIPVPPGSKVKVTKGTMALSGAADIAVGPGCKLSISKTTEIAGSDMEPASPQPDGEDSAGTRADRPAASQSGELDIAEAETDRGEWPAAIRIKEILLYASELQQHKKAAPPPKDTPVTKGEVITVAYGAKITVVGTADIELPRTSEITARGQCRLLQTRKLLTVPAGTNVIAADMRALLPTAALTIFGIGTGIGLIAVLVGLFSDADLPGRVTTFVAGVLLAVGVLIYGAVANRSLAEPTPGSSLSAGSTSSFTL